LQSSIKSHTCDMTPETLLELLKEIEKEDPIDFSGLPFEEDDLRLLACLNVLELMNNWPQGMNAQARDIIMAATITRLVLENMVLQARIALLIQDE
jgi:hypothetical protein